MLLVAPRLAEPRRRGLWGERGDGLDLELGVPPFAVVIEPEEDRYGVADILFEVASPGVEPDSLRAFAVLDSEAQFSSSKIYGEFIHGAADYDFFGIAQAYRYGAAHVGIEDVQERIEIRWNVAPGLGVRVFVIEHGLGRDPVPDLGHCVFWLA